MKRFFNKKTAVLVVLFSCVSLAVSCVNTNYELSEDKVNTNVTIFQDGLTLPLGTTAPIKMEELYGMLDPELQEIIQNKDGKYGFSYSGNIDLTDTLAALKNVFAIDALSFNETFSFDLSNVSLDGVKFDALSIKPAPLSISGMLNIPDIALPQIKKKESLVHSLPSLDPDALKLSFDPIYNRIDVASFPGLIFNDIYMQYIDWADREMPYSEIKDRIEVINNMIPGKPLPSIPNIDINEGFKPFGETVTLALSLPSQIQAVRSVELNDNASIRISVNVINPLFTTGEVELDMNLSQIFSMEGADEKGHVISTFNVGKNSSQATREYKIKDLMLSSSDWKNNGSALALNKSFTVEVTPSIKQALTTLNYLRAYTYGGMGIELTIEFCNLSIDNVEMEIAPITISETIEMDINVPNVKLPDLVKKVEYVALENPLNISMKAELPKAFSQLCVNLKSLDIDFPKELVVSHDKYANGELSYSNISLGNGFDDEISITRLNLPAPVNGNLTYAGKVKVEANAQASGIVNSRDLLDKSKTGDVRVDIDVNYSPVLQDYGVVIDDYSYTVEIDPISINEELPAAIGEMKEISVYLENNPEIKINLNYPTADGAISIIPHKEKGLKIFFPDMLKFKSLPSSYNYDAATNSISFVGNTRIPNQIVLPIDRLLIKPQKEGDSYYVKTRMEVEGGVCLEGTTITKTLVDRLVKDKAQISFSAEIPELKPAALALDQYVASISEKLEFDIPSFETLPEMIELKSVEAFTLDNVYLNFSLDASSIVKLMKDVEMSMNFDVTLPKLIKVENAGEGNVMKISGSLDKNNKIVLEPVHVIGLDLSDFDFSSGVINLGKQTISIDGSVSLNNVSLDFADLKGADLKLAAAGSLATKDTDLIKIEKVQAKVGCQFELNETFDLGALFAELKDQLQFILDFNRFHLDLDLKTNLSLPVQLSELSVIPYKGGVAGTPVEIKEPVALNTNANGEVAHSKIRISNLESDKHEDPEYHHVVLDILTLIKEMPDSIQLHLNAGTKENATLALEPSVDYVLAADYALELPLELGKDFNIEFSQTLDGLPEILGDVLALGSLGLSGEVTNSLPLALELEFQLLDVDGNEVPLSEGSGHQIIKAGNMDGSAVKTELNVVLGVQSGVKIPDIAAIKLTFRATSSGAGFAEDNFIQVQLNALIPEGVSVDIKDLMGSSEKE